VPDEEILREQADYYRARASEYDRWFLRQGRYDRGDAANSQWFAEVHQVEAALASVPLDGADVLELAPGTGIWTEQLVERAARLTAVDASAEMIGENRRRLGDRAERVAYELADLFHWAPHRTWDAVVFCFWISHVPDEQLDGFLERVAEMLEHNGAVFFLDGQKEPSSTAVDHELPDGDEVMLRRLDDGREFRVVKNFWSSAELEARCERAGLAVSVHETPMFFQYGIGRRT
jgi:demethylmenaquinone methyltransferase/2-methoxy-6-polyprenyl-1,4-benzoquinol methylase